jgi:4-cresol dehydrogenase (hydroxylating)
MNGSQNASAARRVRDSGRDTSTSRAARARDGEPRGLRQALADWSRAIGAAHVSSDGSALAAAEAATFRTESAIVAILRAGSTQDVQRCLQVARRHKIALYPVSRGQNWGYGSRVPPETGCALLDLSRMNKITGLDRRFGVVTLQPGVTQRQLGGFLRARAPTFWMDTTMAGPDTSVLANVLERGHGRTPFGDHVSFASDFEVVLPNGTIVRTGSGRFADSRTAGINRFATGAYLDGLFVQSNLGVVTAMSISLLPAPETAVVGRIMLRDDNLGPLLDVFRHLKHFAAGSLSGPQLFNAYGVIQRRTRYPWDLAGGRTPLSSASLARLAKEHGVPPWSVQFGLFGSREQVAALKKTIARELPGHRPKYAVVVRDHERVDMDRFRRKGLEAYACFVGELPGFAGLIRTYWRKKSPLPPATSPDPDRDRCGFLWVTPVVPFHASDVKRANAIITRVCRVHGFEPAISFSHVRDRSLHYYAALAFDRENPEEDAGALRCHAVLTDELMKAGYYFHRLPLVAMNVLERQDPGFTSLYAAIKQAVDPDGILAPGRYDLGRREPKDQSRP